MRRLSAPEKTAMFTGIVQAVGLITDVRRHAGGVRLSMDAAASLRETKLGDSVCISGACLTVAGRANGQWEFDIIQETISKTTFGALKSGDRVNLEPAMRSGDRFDGHFVQGHVDGTAAIEQVISTQAEYVIWMRPQPHLLAYIVPKGSVAVDGVSMTVAQVDGGLFSIALIPTTLERTTLGGLRAGDNVNIETDMLARTVVHYLRLFLGSGDHDGLVSTEPIRDQMARAAEQVMR